MGVDQMLLTLDALGLARKAWAGHDAAPMGVEDPAGVAPSGGSGLADATAWPGEALVSDLDRTLAGLGLVSVRAAITDLAGQATGQRFATRDDRMDPQPGRAGGSDGRAEPEFPGAAELVAALLQQAVDQTAARRLSPRRWLLGWRMDDQHAVLARVHLAQGRDSLDDALCAVIRAACTAGLVAGIATGGAGRLAPCGVGPLTNGGHVSRRTSADDGQGHGASARPDGASDPTGGWPNRLFAAIVVPLGLAVLLMAWLLLWGLDGADDGPGQRSAQTQRLQAMSDAQIRRAMLSALHHPSAVTLQSALEGLAAAGHFEQAILYDAQRVELARVGGRSRDDHGVHELLLQSDGQTVGCVAVLHPLDARPSTLLQPWRGALAGVLALVLVSLGAVCWLRRRRLAAV